MTIEAAAAAVANYVAAWDAPNEDGRRTVLERTWTDDGVYCDPTAVVEGREALVAHIGRFHGARVVATSGVDAYDGHLRFACGCSTRTAWSRSSASTSASSPRTGG